MTDDFFVQQDREQMGVSTAPQMSPAASAAWNDWCVSIIQQMLEPLAGDIGTEIRLLRSDVKELRTENVRLREALADLRGESRGRAMLDLPALPVRNHDRH